MPELFGPRHDVACLGRLLGDPEVGNYRVFELLERDSTRLLEELEPLFDIDDGDANVLLYYAGHVLAEPGRGLYLATADTRLDAIKGTALSIAAVKNLLRRSRAAEMTVVLDCCYSSPTGRFDEHDVEHDLRRVRTEVSSNLHLLASPAATRRPADRETPTDTGLEGAMTRCIVEGLATGAADRNGDNTTRASELNEYLGMRMGDGRPLWAGPLEGVDPVIVANPHPIEGVDVVHDDAPGGRNADARGLPVRVAGAVLVVIAAIVAGYLLRDRGAQRSVRIDEYYAGSSMPETQALFDDVDALRAVVNRTGWIEHTEPLDGRGPRYPGVVAFRLDPNNDARPGTVRLRPRQWAEVELSDGVFGVGVACAAGLNVAEVLVELTDGDRFVFDVRTEEAGGEFFGFVSPIPIDRLRIRSTSAGFAAERLYVYADREHRRVGGDAR